MVSIMTLSVGDISKRLGVHPYTVRRWIEDGLLKASMINNRQGYRVKINDFDAFIEEHPRYNVANREDVLYETAKCDILKDLMIGLYEMERKFLLEDHGKVYSEGWNNAVEQFDNLIKDTLVLKSQ